MRRLHCQLPADRMVKSYYSLLYSHLSYALLAWGRSGRTNVAKIECAHRSARKLLADYNHRILTFHSIYDYFALLKAFNTNTLNFHQYFKDKSLSSSPNYFRIFSCPISHATLGAWFNINYQITCQPVKQAISIFIIMQIVL